MHNYLTDILIITAALLNIFAISSGIEKIIQKINNRFFIIEQKLKKHENMIEELIKKINILWEKNLKN